ncbi:hypothetical protein KNP414_00451 [Paenibacillus mucilaginosus KNP414]|uniref:Uncharacterized protein n=1 Tax=Paenibacillus mucilaginosus (strain KNP414) TaxID=1036673 RepID=F8FPC6_PAEMK|nr:hypothetical protein KNP414_00451 [Paenibacillus mucilaginosus KNP414]
MKNNARLFKITKKPLSPAPSDALTSGGGGQGPAGSQAGQATTGPG